MPAGNERDNRSEQAGRLKLAPKEAARLVALALIAIAVVVAALLRSNVSPPPAETPMVLCPDGARRVAGRIVCGAKEGEPLTQAELLLVGSKLDINAASAADLELIPGIGP